MSDQVKISKNRELTDIITQKGLQCNITSLQFKCSYSKHLSLNKTVLCISAFFTQDFSFVLYIQLNVNIYKGFCQTCQPFDLSMWENCYIPFKYIGKKVFKIQVLSLADVGDFVDLNI